MNFSPTWTFRSLVDTFACEETRVLDVMYPKFATRGFVTGSASSGWFGTLKTSSRSSEFNRSRILNLLKSDVSQLWKLGPRMMPRPALPKVPALGCTNAAGLNHGL